VLQECYESVTSVLQDRYKSVTRKIVVPLQLDQTPRGTHNDIYGLLQAFLRCVVQSYAMLCTICYVRL
jgi:hypothetical protein